MKIKCNYCGNFFDDTNEKCPNCGAPNPGVVRTTSKQPLTIDQLIDWYHSKGLPPYETTRFFIGQNYNKPRAFGIYKDEKTGNFVVYKNKDSGQRAIRYEGTDEAYAVNELYQRLKEEIIQQKQSNLKSKTVSQPTKGLKSSLSEMPGCLGGCLTLFLMAIGLPLLLVIVGVIAIWVEDYPERGYYSYDNSTYYNFINDESKTDTDWFIYSEDEAEWSDPILSGMLPENLEKDKTAKNYYLCEEWNSSLPVPDFRKSDSFSKRMIDYYDRKAAHKIDTGYYHHSGNTYYHLKENSSVGWYIFDTEINDWEPVGSSEVPDDLQHTVTAPDFYYTPTWDSSTQITDFKDTDAYTSYQAEKASSASSSSSSSSSSSWDDDDSTSWDSSDSWDSGSSDWSSDW